jgi:hypothetical protein
MTACNGPEIRLSQLASRSKTAVQLSAGGAAKAAIAHLDLSKATTLGNLHKLVLSALALKISLDLRLGGLPGIDYRLLQHRCGEASPLVIIVLPHREAGAFRHGGGQPDEHPLGTRRGS